MNRTLVWCLLFLSGCGVTCTGDNFEVTVRPATLELFPGESGLLTMSPNCANASSIFTVSYVPEPLDGLEVNAVGSVCESSQPLTVKALASARPGTYELFITSKTNAPVDQNSVRLSVPIVVKDPVVSPTPGLDVTISGPGTVRSEPAGIACASGVCSHDFAVGTVVTLMASGIEPAHFMGWSGSDDCADGQVTIGSTRLHCTATFVAGSGGWVSVGAALNITDAGVPALVYQGALEVDHNDSITAAWLEADQLRVARWSGTAWVALGGKINDRPVNSAPSLAFDSADTPVVAWDEATIGEGGNVYVARWSGTAWEKLGGGPLDVMATDFAREPCVRQTPTGVAVAWAETVAGASHIFVKQWNGAAWANAGTTEGPPSVPNESARSPKLQLVGEASAPVLHLAWVQNNTRLKVSTLDRGAWRPNPTDVLTGLSVPAFDLSDSVDDGLVIAVVPPTGSAVFQVKALKNDSVTNLGAPRGVTGGVNPVVVSVGLSHGLHGFPVLAWSYRADGVEQVLVEQWASGAWGRIGTPIAPKGRTGHAGFATWVAPAETTRPMVLEVVQEQLSVSSADSSIGVLEFR